MAGLSSPQNFTIALTHGFRNAAKAYGDGTVRSTTTITGFTSEIPTAGQEFVTGLYDGFFGIVKTPSRV